MICFNCKAVIEDGSGFCPECGCRQLPATGAPAASAPDLDATQMAPPPDATQAVDYDATQAAPYAVNQAADYTQPVPDYDATQAAPYGTFVPPANPYYAQAPVTPEPPKKSNKGVIIAVAGAITVLLAVLAVLAFKFLPELGLFEKDDEKDDDGKKITEVHTKKETDITTSTEAISLLDEMTAPEVATIPIVIPTVPKGNDTGSIGSADRFTRPAATAPPTTARPKPTSAPTTKPQATQSPYYEEETTFAYLDTPYTTVDAYADQVHIAGTFYDGSTATHVEYGYFYSGTALCLYMGIPDGEIVIEYEDDYYTAYVRSAGDISFTKENVSQSDCDDLANNVIDMLIELGYDNKETYPDRTFEYLGDFRYGSIGYVEEYNVYEDGEIGGIIYVDTNSGYYAAVLDTDGTAIFKASLIDVSGSSLPYNYK